MIPNECTEHTPQIPSRPHRPSQFGVVTALLLVLLGSDQQGFEFSHTCCNLVTLLLLGRLQAVKASLELLLQTLAKALKLLSDDLKFLADLCCIGGLGLLADNLLFPESLYTVLKLRKLGFLLVHTCHKLLIGRAGRLQAWAWFADDSRRASSITAPGVAVQPWVSLRIRVCSGTPGLGRHRATCLQEGGGSITVLHLLDEDRLRIEERRGSWRVCWRAQQPELRPQCLDNTHGPRELACPILDIFCTHCVGKRTSFVQATNL